MDPPSNARLKTVTPLPTTFPIARTDSPYDFSFSGLKTAVLREVTVQPSGQAQRKRIRGAEKRAKLRAMTSTLRTWPLPSRVRSSTPWLHATIMAARQNHCSEIFLSGGVSANQMLRRRMQEVSTLPVRYPSLSLCTDNAAMIAAAAHYRYGGGHRSGLEFEARSSPGACRGIFTQNNLAANINNTLIMAIPLCAQ